MWGRGRTWTNNIDCVVGGTPQPTEKSGFSHPSFPIHRNPSTYEKFNQNPVPPAGNFSDILFHTHCLWGDKWSAHLILYTTTALQTCSIDEHTGTSMCSETFLPVTYPSFTEITYCPYHLHSGCVDTRMLHHTVTWEEQQNIGKYYGWFFEWMVEVKLLNPFPHQSWGTHQRWVAQTGEHRTCHFQTMSRQSPIISRQCPSFPIVPSLAISRHLSISRYFP